MHRRTSEIAAHFGAMALVAIPGPAAASPTAMPLIPSPASPAAATPAAPGVPAPPGAVILTPQAVAALSHEAKAAIRELIEISQQVRAGQAEQPASRLRLLLASPAYAELPPQLRHVGYGILANLDLRAGRIDEAQTAILRATAIPGATAEEWELQVNIALARHDARGAVVALTRLAQAFPAAMPIVPDAVALGVYAAARALPDGSDLRFQLGQALIAANWKPGGPFDDDSGFIVEQAALLIDRGDLAGARGVIGLVDEPVMMVGPRADKRFDPILATDPTAFDLRALAEKRKARIAEAAAAAPGLMAGVDARAATLVAFGRYAEALPLLDAALAKAQPADGGASAYVDTDTQLASTMALRARALAGLGRYDEALDQMNRAASRPESGRINVTQRMALARLQIEMGRPKEALSTLDVLAPSDITVEGEAAAQALRLCAAARAGDTAAAKAALDVVQAHRDVSPLALQDALACAGDLDGAAKLVIERLNDPDRRLAVLAWAQTLKRPPAPPGDHAGDLDQHDALVARPDVKAAIDRVGRIESVPLYAAYF